MNTNCATAPPEPLAVLAENIPDSLKHEHRWVIWRYAWVDDYWTKVPFIATSPNTKASSTNSTTWSSFEEALTAYEAGKCNGIGFVLGDGYSGFDADHQTADEYVLLLNSYTERSPSGDGVHVLFRGHKPGSNCRTGPYELYDKGRYFTVTGQHLLDTPATVEERTAELAVLYEQLWPPKQDRSSSTASPATELTDDVLVAKAHETADGEKFAALWSGEHTQYPSRSEAVLALCCKLAFWTNKNAAQMDRLFRRSGLYTKKWDSRRGDTTLGRKEIAKAIANTPRGYVLQPTLLTSRKASEIADEILETMFGGRLVRSTFGLIVGPGDIGKGMVAVDAIARLTTGQAFPGETAGRSPMVVMMCVTEDSKGRVKSRLQTAGADLEMVHFIEGPEVTVGGLSMPSPMMLLDDAAGLLQKSKDLQASVLYLETTVEHMGDRAGLARINTAVEADVRRALAPVREVCKRQGLYGFGAMHPRKARMVQ